MARLIVLSGEDLGKEFPVREETLIGRSPQSGVTLAHASVSREHARIVWETGAATIVDLQSSNGTFVNGERVQRALLRPGDEIRLGQFLLRFAADVEVEEIQLEEETTPAGAPAVPLAPAMPAAKLSPEKKSISDKPVRPVAAAKSRASLLGQDVTQYGGYYRVAILLGVVLLAAGVFLGVRYLSSKAAEKAQDGQSEEESDER